MVQEGLGMSALNGGVRAEQCGFVSWSPALVSARAES